MFGEDFEVCRFGVESVLCVGPVVEGFVAGATTSAQSTEHLPIKIDEVWIVFRRLDLYCMHDQSGPNGFYLSREKEKVVKCEEEPEKRGRGSACCQFITIGWRCVVVGRASSVRTVLW